MTHNYYQKLYHGLVMNHSLLYGRRTDEFVVFIHRVQNQHRPVNMHAITHLGL